LVETALPINFPPSEDTARVGVRYEALVYTSTIFEAKNLLFWAKKDKEGQRP
jgi:hypothetical protein